MFAEDAKLRPHPQAAAHGAVAGAAHLSGAHSQKKAPGAARRGVLAALGLVTLGALLGGGVLLAAGLAPWQSTAGLQPTAQQAAVLSPGAQQQQQQQPAQGAPSTTASTPQEAEPLRLVTVVLYSSHEGVYIDALLRNTHLFSDVVVLAVGARQFDSTPEDVVHLAELHDTFPEVVLALYPVRANETDAIALHNRGREYGVVRGRRELVKRGLLQQEQQAGRGWSNAWFLMLDGDEVPDGARFRQWWRDPATRQRLANASEAYKLANYWLFMLPRLVAEQVEDSVLLVHDAHLTRTALNHPRDRDGIWMANSQTLHVHRAVPGLDGLPMFWHYSWVRRTRAALLHKVMTWGHNTDRTDWRKLVDEAYALVDQGKVPQDFVHGYKLRWVAQGDTSHPQPPVVW